ncbi:SDR family NAD(P)-dependent oxidoreductase [Enterovirga rhinocerotis]|uniref:NADP-dependent 3-hydroxy acid dehydrogenase YdfG n=1 Tax=Enterovirga rhinocerotis TaxID=1339210 RepID=A0A4R7C0Y1_9HYPH|nr:SDR family NAD(P)-dependent oxidoreductase [Enterovirga rhinocerotis]TDR90036.1 NADP-dependent 3-hydroxy acid dehydrogenase YdfG [Enterovirga rhinocerotis]
MKLDNSMAAVVTGAASGLGEATARLLADQGVRVAVFDLNAERGTQVADEIDGIFCQVDVTSDESVAAALASARSKHGTERILVNCAGIAPGRRTVSKNRETGKPVGHDMKTFKAAIEINLIGTFRMIAASAAGMAELDPATPDGGRGVIVNTASVAGVEGQIGQAAYAASKGGVLGLTLPVARDLAGYGIRVMTIMPGLFHTPMFDGLPDEVRTALETTIPFPSRLGKAQEYAKLVRAIVENDMLNGEAIRLDGALRMQPK